MGRMDGRDGGNDHKAPSREDESMIVVGIDPGHSGGAIAVQSGRVIAGLSWRRYGRKVPPTYIRITWRRDDGICDEFSGNPLMHTVIDDFLIGIAMLGGPDAMAVEGLFVPRHPSKGTITHAETTGRVLGSAERWCITIFRPKASEWRPMILGLRPNCSSDDAERAAMMALMPKRGILQGYRDLPRGIRDSMHVAEAACLAKYALLKRGKLADTRS